MEILERILCAAGPTAASLAAQACRSWATAAAKTYVNTVESPPWGLSSEFPSQPCASASPSFLCTRCHRSSSCFAFVVKTQAGADNQASPSSCCLTAVLMSSSPPPPPQDHVAGVVCAPVAQSHGQTHSARDGHQLAPALHFSVSGHPLFFPCAISSRRRACFSPPSAFLQRHEVTEKDLRDGGEEHVAP